MPALVVINPISGPQRRRSISASRALAHDVLQRHGIEVEVVVTGARGDAHRFAAAARDSGLPLVVAWGGDGTINEVASALVGSQTCLAIVPGGSGNGLARDLGVPLDCVHALELAAAGRPRMIDAGQVDDCWFFNVAGVGLDAQIARHMTRPGARRGLAGYVQLTFSELPFYRAQPYTIDLSGTSASYRALFVAIANSRQYGNGAQIAPAARLDDGHLDLVIVESQPLWRLLAQVPALFGGTLRSGRGLQMIPITEAVIRGSGSLAFHVDGEPMHGGNALRIRTRPGALAVMAPN